MKLKYDNVRIKYIHNLHVCLYFMDLKAVQQVKC